MGNRVDHGCLNRHCDALCSPVLLFHCPHQFGGSPLCGNHVRFILLLERTTRFPPALAPCFGRWQVMWSRRVSSSGTSALFERHGQAALVFLSH